MARWLLLLGLAWLVPNTAHAYLDPGSGSILVYALVGLIASLAFSIRGLYYRLVGLFSGSKRIRAGIDTDIVFFSEGRHYWGTFESTIQALNDKGHRVTYLTQHEDDPGLLAAEENPALDARYIGSGHQSFLYLNSLKAKLVAMTTPQLDIMMLKRSKQVDHYMHLVHAPTDALVYKKFAFDYFDSVCCSGPHQADSIRALERVRELPQKKLYVTGLNYYDQMLAMKDDGVVSTEAKTVLVAPTWGEHAMFAVHGTDFIKDLSQAGYKVIVRPHPQIKKSQPEIFNRLSELADSEAGIELDTQPSGHDSMRRAALLISDLSGIIFDFLFIFEKPVISIDPYVEHKGHEAEDVEHIPWEQEAVSDLCVVVDGDLSGLADTVAEVLGSPLSEKVWQMRDSFVPHLGHAGQRTADAIVDVLTEKEGAA